MSTPSVLVVEVDGERFGLPADRVNTVVGYEEPVPIPGRPKPFLGALNHHGELLPVVHLASVLGLKPRVDPLRSVVAVVDWEDGILGLLVERAQGLVTPLARARVAQVLGRWDGPFLDRTLEVEGARIHVLDLDALLRDLAERVR
ncbi:chemotaxis protein CheW [Deferrisoma sp.]